MKDSRERYVENESCEMWIDEDILIFRYKDHVKKLTGPVTKSIVDLRVKTFNDKQYPIVIFINNVIGWDRESRVYLTTEGVKFISIAAYVIKSYIVKVGLNILQSVTRNQIPSKYFSNEDDAKKWIKMAVPIHLN